MSNYTYTMHPSLVTSDRLKTTKIDDAKTVIYDIKEFAEQKMLEVQEY